MIPNGPSTAARARILREYHEREFVILYYPRLLRRSPSRSDKLVNIPTCPEESLHTQTSSTNRKQVEIIKVKAPLFSYNGEFSEYIEGLLSHFIVALLGSSQTDFKSPNEIFEFPEGVRSSVCASYFRVCFCVTPPVPKPMSSLLESVSGFWGSDMQFSPSPCRRDHLPLSSEFSEFGGEFYNKSCSSPRGV